MAPAQAADSRMDFESTRRHLREFKYRELFIEDLGWSLPPTETVETLKTAGHEWQWSRVAVQGGIAVIRFNCDGAGLPTDRDTRKKVHKAMRRHHHEHLLIFCDLDAGQSLWSWMGGKKDDSLGDHYFIRFQSGDLFLSKLESLYFALFGLDHEDSPREDVLEVTRRLRRALDTEQVTKRFFSEYQQKRNDFYKSIKGIHNEHDLQRYASVLLNRMMFTWFLQKKGFLGGGDTDYLPSRLNARHKKRPDSYYKEFLLSLFFDGFGKQPQERSKKTRSLVGDIPFLGGSLFLPHVLESKYTDTIQIDDEAFFGITKQLNSYIWHLDHRPAEDDDEIAPSVLGMIFEKYINQKQFGAYARSRLRSEIDALIALRCGLTEKEYVHLVESFPLVDYRAKDAAYNEFCAAERVPI